MSLEFIGVYATSEKAPSLGDFPRPMVSRKRLWFVWETPEGKFQVQALNAVHLPMAEPHIISAKEFHERFTEQKDCDAVPEGYEKPQEEVNIADVPLPDLFKTVQDIDASGGQPFGLPLPEVLDDGRVKADDPGLLQAWAKADPPQKRRNGDATKIPFDRLVGEVVGFPDEENALAEPPSPADPVDGAAPDAGEVEQVRFLRSKFVQALLLLRRGERNESVMLLKEVLAQPYPPFAGASQLFSEFGLGLRRLGLASLALMAHKRALEFAPRDERVLFNIARSYHDLDHVTEAREYLEEALAVAPDFPQARQFLAFLEIKSAEGGK